ncbi:glycosyltransferase [Herbiconiux sp. KACC 21604]|uniref:glycosyltransferase n=1 Tax=unclassified Herbiconiux TaxID=2618217 RepID=UPI001490CD8B|nr:glycosyltransferase [Herbiconiux sp. SALV-R1]QJU53399.1 glycosyltransferase family 1 protein [Herbiconiux sp. SALV-R1]WPO88364.1 glycosyltransferase [Herbiconiux sp. KACC 21604]
MSVLVISPDYASHLLPLVTLAGAWLERGEEVVVATGESTEAIVAKAGARREHLQLGRGSNPGVIRAEEQPRDEGASLRGFFEATRRGMIPTLRYQAEQRLTDLMWQPVQKARETVAVVDAVQPDTILVDHLAFSARLGLQAARIPYTDVVLGHPSALPVGDELYGLPSAWPACFTPPAEEVERLRELCLRVSESFTREWNTALAELDPLATPSPSAFSETGESLLFNYPAALADPSRAAFLPPHRYLGSTPRDDGGDVEVERWIASSDEPFVYVSFGSFLSVRDDVLARVADALREAGLRAAIATGSGDPARLGSVPDSWLVREFLPQVTLLRSAAAAVTHGGNNSVTEAATFGVPLVVLPFSTDQFAGAAALERAGVGVALDPNTATVPELAAALRTITGDAAVGGGASGGGVAGWRGGERMRAIAAELAAAPGPELAYRVGSPIP